MFVMNLDRHSDRLANIEKLFNRFNLQFTRIPGVDGNSLSDKEVKKITNFYTSFYYGFPLSKGSIGTVLSHKKVYQEIVNTNLDGAFIFEDDVVFDERLPYMIKNHLYDIKKWDFFTFGEFDKPFKFKFKINFQLNIDNKNYKFVTIKNPPFLHHAYYVSHKFAKYRLHDLEKIIEPIDNYRFSKYHFNTGGIHPFISDQIQYKDRVSQPRNEGIHYKFSFKLSRIKNTTKYILQKMIIKPIIFFYSIKKKSLPLD